jgi:hypothetical protein
MTQFRANRSFLVSRRVIRPCGAIEQICECVGGKVKHRRNHAAGHQAPKTRPVKVLEEPEVNPRGEFKAVTWNPQEVTGIRHPMEAAWLLRPGMSTTGEQPGDTVSGSCNCKHQEVLGLEQASLAVQVEPLVPVYTTGHHDLVSAGRTGLSDFARRPRRCSRTPRRPRESRPCPAARPEQRACTGFARSCRARYPRSSTTAPVPHG